MFPTCPFRGIWPESSWKWQEGGGWRLPPLVTVTSLIIPFLLAVPAEETDSAAVGMGVGCGAHPCLRLLC